MTGRLFRRFRAWGRDFAGRLGCMLWVWLGMMGRLLRTLLAWCRNFAVGLGRMLRAWLGSPLGVRVPEPFPTDGTSLVNYTGDWQAAFTPLKYYDYVRKEIEREDNITNQRLTWAMAFQGFLIASMTFLLSGSWPDQADEMAHFRKLVIGALGVVGFLAASLTVSGIDASRNAIDQVVKDWEAINSKLRIVPQFAPRTYGQEKHFLWGSRYVRLIPRLFQFMWLAYFLAYVLRL